MNNVAIIGGGAAGFFSAIWVKNNYPECEVTIFERSHNLLSKVKISGGGRCNLTNACNSISELCKAYPRGGKELKKIFNYFNNNDTIKWFEQKNVKLVVQEDNCVFPASQDSQTIIDYFLSEAKRLKIKIETKKNVNKIIKSDNNNLFNIFFENKSIYDCEFNKVIVTTGGSPKKEGLKWLSDLGHKIEIPVPSLFSFNISCKEITKLMGIVANNVLIRVKGTKIKSEGTLLITHWGFSGPAILALSSYGARLFSELNYNFQILINWINIINDEIVYDNVINVIKMHPLKKVSNHKPFSLPERLWLYIVTKANICKQKKWNELSKKEINKIVTFLTNDEYFITSKSKFTEEFVTCGGISLNSIDTTTMQSKYIEGLYFAGEVLDIDGITGGFNFQAAWSTAYLAAKLT